MTKNELRLLGTYADGPRIWDATEILPTVSALEDLGLVERVGAVGYLYRLTDEGHRALRHTHGPAYKPGTVSACTACQRIKEAERNG